MKAKITHHCPLPACDFTLDDPLPVMPTELTVEVIRDFTARMQLQRQEVNEKLSAHMATHFMTGQPSVDGPVVIDALTDDDAMPAFGLGDDVSLLLLLRRDEIAQIIGRPDLDLHAVAHALIECAQTIHTQALGKRVAVFCAERPEDPTASLLDNV